MANNGLNWTKPVTIQLSLTKALIYRRPKKQPRSTSDRHHPLRHINTRANHIEPPLDVND